MWPTMMKILPRIIPNSSSSTILKNIMYNQHHISKISKNQCIYIGPRNNVFFSTITPSELNNNSHKRKKSRKQTIPQLPINNQIRASSIRLVDNDGKQVGIISKREALARAKEQGLDLVPVSRKEEDPQICKILNYGQFHYDMKKRLLLNKKKAVTVSVKEVKLGVTIEENDLMLKQKQITSFLEKGNHVRIKVAWGKGKFRFLEQGKTTLKRVLETLEPIASADGIPQQTFSSLVVTVRPKKRE